MDRLRHAAFAFDGDRSGDCRYRQTADLGDAVLSGYLGSAEQGEHILGIVRQVKAANPAAKYFCDPVMGHPEKGCIVAPGVAEFHVRYALPASDIIAPNLVELEILCGHPVASVSEAVAAARELIAQGPEVVLVKHLARAGLSMDRFEMLLVTAEEAWHISRPLVDFGLRQPVGRRRCDQWSAVG
ncbi:pyridoxal kinase [Klebsiella pneumoniae subsp. ozaenae]|uniref:pyridoxal kinase n=1 Tax=Klebsiella pneumoniae subsp. ozaenae TaxID=574 RepID=A0A378B439_KLEPO|nr:pyridoxal kinase [Klebsiella pneumoniae subsp. ozaenae]